MIPRLRSRFKAPSPALVISLIALFVALGGTSYAAIALPKNSVGTAQLKNDAVTGAKIKNRAVTASKINAKGFTAPNANKLDGAAASHYVRVGGTLASGDTETGAYGVAGQGVLIASVSFVPKLGAAPAHADYVTSTTTSNCPGYGQAAAGYFCIYEGSSANMDLICIGGTADACGGSPTVDGAEIFFQTTGGEANVAGTWAYTQP